jgi:hypothetical protein
MIHYARFRPRLTKLTLAWVWLGLVSAGLSIASTYKMDVWLSSTIWVTGGVLVLALFVWPSLRYYAHYLDVLSTGLNFRLGLGAAKRVELAWVSIASVTASPIKGIVVRTKEENEYILRGYSNQRAIVAEINAQLGRK